MLKEYSTSPEQGWKAKDCAIFLVLALAVQGKTAAAGGVKFLLLLRYGCTGSNAPGRGNVHAHWLLPVCVMAETQGCLL